MRRLAALGAALAALASADAAAAGDIYLYSPLGPRPAPPPLLSQSPGSARLVELRIPGRVASRQLVDVGIGPDGAPVHVTATQRLTIDGVGDYSFLIPAPATRVVRGRGSESLPGLREGGILWQGFSDGRRVLSASASLRPGPAAAALPLRVRITRGGGSTVVGLVNATRRRTRFQSGRTTAARLRTTLERLRAYYRAPQTARGVPSVEGRPGGIVRVDVAAPLRVTGTIFAGRSPVTVDETLGARGPFERRVVLRGSGPARLRLRVEPLPTSSILPSAAELARRDDALIKLQTSLDAIQTATAYRTYLASPDRFGASSATYLYRSVPRPVAAGAAPTAQSDGGSTLAIVVLVALGAAGVTGLAVLWARS